MKLIVGLGNPGEKYRNNRHNIGYMFVDYLSKKLDAGNWKLEKIFDAELYKTEIKKEKLILAKPQSFMNNSGITVNKLISSFKLQASTDLSVIHDDLDIRLGEYKIQIGKGPKLHNGIESIENEIGTKEFTRMRIGVDNRDDENRMPGEKYVLQNFTEEEMEVLEKVFQEIIKQFLI